MRCLPPATTSPVALVIASTFYIGCGADGPHHTVLPNPTTSTVASAAPTNPTTSTPKASKTGFENPGGMWLPSQIASHQDPLKLAGFELDAKVLTDPLTAPLGAVVSLGGCSASFVSPDGLLVTNHHCVTRILQFNSTPEKDISKTGYLAKTRADEKWAGPTSRVFITQSFKDVTSEMRAGLDSLPDDRARFDKLEEREKALLASCEKGRSDVRCSVKSYFGGAQYLLIEQLELRDVRLVYAPAEGVGDFGGEIDNWRWPRHSGDFSFLRVYVNKDQKPADHSDTNIPYKPPHYLRVASKPLGEGDFVAVAGYPGRTNRLRTAAEVRESLDWEFPRRIEAYEQGIAALEDLDKRQPKLHVKIHPILGGLGNGLTRTKGIADGLSKGGLLARREKEDAALAAWIEADPQRKKTFGNVMEQLGTLVAKRKQTRDEEMALGAIVASSELLGAALTIVQLAEERDKPDAARAPEFQERNWKLTEQRLTRLTSSYDRAIDTTRLAVTLELIGKRLPNARPEFVTTIVGGKLDRASIDKAVAALFTSTLEGEKARVTLFRKAKKAELARSNDPLIRLAVKLYPAVVAMENRDKALTGAMSLLRPRYFEALQQMRGTVLAPDANGTLRVTYGTVRGYRPTADAPVYRPFTTASEMVAKVTNKEPFNPPAKFADAVRAKKFGKYVSPTLGEVPVDFLSDVDTTGGNSGSPTINSKGELVGLLFDGTYESQGSDVMFMPDLTRAVHVDFRYVQWVLDVDGGDNVLLELGVTPSID